MLEDRNKLAWVDAMRGWAILGVLMVHVGINENAPFWIKAFIVNGARGVQLFFLMSAFTMFYTYNRHVKEELNYVENFFIRRFFRIAPLYYIAICWYLWMNGNQANYWTGYMEGITIGNILANVFFVHGLYPYYINSLVPGGWSITDEMMFYLFVPFLFMKIKNLKQATWLLFVCLCIRKGFYFVLEHVLVIEPTRLLNEYLFLYLPGQISVFAMGIILYFIFDSQYRLKENWKLLTIIAGLCLASGWIVQISFVFAAIIIFVNKFHFGFLQNKIICFIGKVSYGIYLTHFTMITLYGNLGLNNLINENNIFTGFFLKFLFVFMGALFTAKVLHFLIEKPMINFGRKCITKKEREYKVVKIL